MQHNIENQRDQNTSFHSLWNPTITLSLPHPQVPRVPLETVLAYTSFIVILLNHCNIILLLSLRHITSMVNH